jgi:hypothetical protein
MSIADEITREVIYTDHNVADDARIEVVISMHQGRPVANIRVPKFPIADWPTASDIREPDLLRSYAHCMLQAAEEMERIGGAYVPEINFGDRGQAVDAAGECNAH